VRRLLLLIALATPCHGVEAPPKYLNTWGGLDVFHDSAKVADTDATALSNVLTDRGFLEKRTGSELFQTLLDGWSVLYLQEFVSSSKTRYLIGHASSTVYASDTATAFAAISTTTLGYDLDCVAAFGKEYCVDGVATPWGWNGTAVTRLSSAPICTFIEFADERLYCANTTAGDSRVHAGAYGDAADWAVPVTNPLPAAVPNMWTFNRTDGEGITCFKVTPWGKFVGKLHSTHILKGQDNDSYYKRTIDPSIGCVDDRSVQMVDGVLMWLALDGVYAWGGSGKPELISQDIDSEIKAARQLDSNKANWVNSSQADWQAGALDASGPGALVSATIVQGSITPSTWSVVSVSTALYGSNAAGFETFSDLEYNNNPTWDVVLNHNCTATGGYLSSPNTASCNATVATTQTTGTWQWKILTGNLRPTSQSLFVYFLNDSYSNTIVLRVNGQDNFPGPSNQVALLYNNVAFCTWDATVPDYTWITYKVTRTSTGYFTAEDSYGGGCQVSYPQGTITPPGVGFTVDLTQYQGIDDITNLFSSSGTYYSAIYDTGLSTPIGGVFVSTLTTGHVGTYMVRDSTSPNNDLWTSTQTVANGDKIPLNRRYWQYLLDMSTGTTPTIPSSTVTLTAVTSAYYLSPVKYIGTDITSFLTFDANETIDGGSVTYWTRTSTGSFTLYSSTPAWVAQTNHLQVASSTAPYYQWKSQFNIGSASNTIVINDVTTNWNDGESAAVASLVWDHRYHLCVMNSISTLVNDRCWVYQRNKRWTHFDGINYSALTLFDNKPLAGSAGTDGAIDKIMRPGVYSDKGVAIDAYWETPDYTWEQPNHHKTLRNLWLDAEYNSGGTLDVGYALNRGTVFTSTATTLDSTAGYVSKRVENLVDGYAKGRYIRLRFGNDILDKYFRLNTVTIYGEVEPLISD